MLKEKTVIKPISIDKSKETSATSLGAIAILTMATLGIAYLLEDSPEVEPTDDNTALEYLSDLKRIHSEYSKLICHKNPTPYQALREMFKLDSSKLKLIDEHEVNCILAKIGYREIMVSKIKRIYMSKRQHELLIDTGNCLSDEYEITWNDSRYIKYYSERIPQGNDVLVLQDEYLNMPYDSLTAYEVKHLTDDIQRVETDRKQEFTIKELATFSDYGWSKKSKDVYLQFLVLRQVKNFYQKILQHAKEHPDFKVVCSASTYKLLNERYPSLASVLIDGEMLLSVSSDPKILFLVDEV